MLNKFEETSFFKMRTSTLEQDFSNLRHKKSSTSTPFNNSQKVLPKHFGSLATESDSCFLDSGNSSDSVFIETNSKHLSFINTTTDSSSNVNSYISLPSFHLKKTRENCSAAETSKHLANEPSLQNKTLSHNSKFDSGIFLSDSFLDSTHSLSSESQPNASCLNYSAGFFGFTKDSEFRDIIGCLSKSHCLPPIEVIVQYMKLTDLNNMCLVNKSWRLAISFTRSFKTRRKRALSFLQSQKNDENLFGKKANSLPRKLTHGQQALGIIQSTAKFKCFDVTSTQESSPTSKFSNSCIRFWKEANELKSSESLTRCPQCSGPAHVNKSEKSGHCSSISCEYIFCIECQNRYHFPHPCRLKQSPTKKLQTLAGSKKSKRNLKRL